MSRLEEMDEGLEQTAPVWAVFGDLMTGLLGAFVLVLLGVLVVQMDLVDHLQLEVQKRQAEEQRRMTLEKFSVRQPFDVNDLGHRGQNPNFSRLRA